MPSRLIKRSYRSVTGKISSSKSPYAFFESTLERDLFYQLEFDQRVISWESQPFTLEFDNSELIRSYTPDALADFGTHKVIYEVKYLEDLSSSWAELKPKFKAAIRYAKEQSNFGLPTRFKIMTEKQIRTEHLKNVTFLMRYKNEIVPDEFIGSLTRTLDTQALSINELISNKRLTRFKHANILHYTWTLLAQGFLDADLHKPLNHSTAIRLTENQHVKAG